ncbi:MAG: OmpA family protein [Bacteroidales bacterium]
MKENKKALLLLTFAAVASSTLSSQEVSNENQKRVKLQYVTNNFWDNWHIGLNAGMQFYLGEGDSQAATKDRITPAINIEAGKWFTPIFGARAVVGGFKINSTELYEPTNINSWNYYQVRLDMMFNPINAISYNPKRIYEPIFYAGLGLANGKEVKAVLTEQIGLINNFRVNKCLDINLEAGVSLYPENWDGKTGNRSLDGLFTLTAGVSYKFPQRDFKTYDAQCPVEVTRLNKQVNELHASLDQANIKNRELEENLTEANNREPQVIEVIKESPKTTAIPVTILFDLNSSVVKREQYLTLSNMAEVIKANPEKIYTIIGYADRSTGSEEYNHIISQRRAESVLKALVDRFGVNQSQLSTQGKGASEQLFLENSWNRVAVIIEK